VLFGFDGMPDCELGHREVLPLAVHATFCGFALQEFDMVLRRRVGRNNALGRAHSPAIESRSEIASLAGLFRPTRLLFAPQFQTRRNAIVLQRIVDGH
jgi:hypothetical protein